MNDTSRRLCHDPGVLCDFRLGSPEPYGRTAGDVDAEAAYVNESHGISSDLRDVIVEMLDIGERILKIEGFSQPA